MLNFFLLLFSVFRSFDEVEAQRMFDRVNDVVSKIISADSSIVNLKNLELIMAAPKHPGFGVGHALVYLERPDLVGVLSAK